MAEEKIYVDPKISFILTNEYKRQQDTVELIASENFASQAVMDFVAVFLLINMLKGTR